MLKRLLLSTIIVSTALNGAVVFPVNVATTNAVAATKTDDWGRAIRTTNLPKNYKDYPYILANLPNDMYEMEHKNHIGTSKSAKEFLSDDKITKSTIDHWMSIIQQYGQTTLNVDYKTINKKWLDSYISSKVNQGDPTINDAIKYIKWVKKNQIQIEGKLSPEPSMIFYRDGSVIVRAQISFKLKHFDKNEGLFNDLWFPKDVYKKNMWYKGYVDIDLSSNVFNGTWDDLKVSGSSSYFRYIKLTK